MAPQTKDRGQRIKTAISMRGHGKLLALAAELNVSAPALSKWVRGNSISLENACALAVALDISLDWLLLARCTPEWHNGSDLTDEEKEFVPQLRKKPRSARNALINLINEIPEQDPH